MDTNDIRVIRPRLEVLSEVLAERIDQDHKLGEQNHPDGTGTPEHQYEAAKARDYCQLRAAQGSVTWADILLEKVYEALAETDPAKLRTELIQVAAVASAWVEAIDRRNSGVQE